MILLAAALVLQSTQEGEAGDPRIRTVPYDAEQVVSLSVPSGYATVVELRPDDRVDTVVVGNSAGWQVTANRAGDKIVVKPLTGATTTNLVVITDARRYTFLLQPGDGGATSPFVMRFVLPEDRSSAREDGDPGIFRLSGDKTLFPLAMSSDGQRTSVRWKPEAPFPAIFASDAKGREALVNGRMVDGVYVIDGIARRYVFRVGKRRAIAKWGSRR